METFRITREDIIKVADDLGKYISEDEINYILRNYPGWQASHPMDCWEIVIEDMIYFLKSHPDAAFEEDASTDDCHFDREDDVNLNIGEQLV